MPSRHKCRKQALQILFQLDARRQPLQDAMAAYYGALYPEETPDPFTELLVRGAMEQMTQIDRRISQHSLDWRLERMPAVDRNILRLAVYEMTQTPTPAVVVISEALELARRFSGEESIPFINGLLEALRRELLPDHAPDTQA